MMRDDWSGGGGDVDSGVVVVKWQAMKSELGRGGGSIR